MSAIPTGREVRSPKPYRATSLKAAQREVRRLRKQEEQWAVVLNQHEQELRLLARLSAKTPQFFNPLDVFAAEKVRDKWLPQGQSQ